MDTRNTNCGHASNSIAADSVRGRPAIEDVGQTVVDSAIRVHRVLGPGLLESAYQECLAYELRESGLRVRCEIEIPIRYGPLWIDSAYRVDMVIEEMVIIENKVVDRLLPVHTAQLSTYLQMSGCRLGFLLNWFVPLMKYGIRRVVNHL